ncbi:MAG TPA: type II toxin-antitoxin system HicB family antitoxin [Gemmatimonadales bacterium]|nr:type II toxin-antitoxin system HicB family antitoxin [Gemmatimonadales bacterium]
MTDVLRYKGYIGRVDVDADAGILHGRVINTRDMITFEGRSVAEAERAFHGSVDDYLEFCESRGEPPDKPFSGKFLVRVSAETHQAIAVAAAREGKSLNQWVAEQLERDAATQSR